MDVLRELVIGWYLANLDFAVRYEPNIDSVRPDWAIFRRWDDLAGIVEVKSFYVDKHTETQLDGAFECTPFTAFWGNANTQRLWQSLRDKASKSTYHDIAMRHHVPYLVALHSDFRAAVSMDDLEVCLFDTDTGIFKIYPSVSGIIYFEDSGSGYRFSHIANPFSSHTIAWPRLSLTANVFRPYSSNDHFSGI